MISSETKQPQKIPSQKEEEKPQNVKNNSTLSELRTIATASKWVQGTFHVNVSQSQMVHTNI